MRIVISKKDLIMVYMTVMFILSLIGSPWLFELSLCTSYLAIFIS